MSLFIFKQLLFYQNSFGFTEIFPWRYRVPGDPVIASPTLRGDLAASLKDGHLGSFLAFGFINKMLGSVFTLIYLPCLREGWVVPHSSFLEQELLGQRLRASEVVGLCWPPKWP